MDGNHGLATSWAANDDVRAALAALHAAGAFNDPEHVPPVVCLLYLTRNLAHTTTTDPPPGS
jgi:hypothetical protein